MKEFQYKNGGRRLYNEDIDRLQELSLAFNAILAGAKLNIVLSGCNVRRTLSTGYSTKYNIEVSAGYAYINGKVRDVPSYSVNDVPTSYVPAIVLQAVTQSHTLMVVQHRHITIIQLPFVLVLLKILVMQWCSILSVTSSQIWRTLSLDMQ